MNGNAVRSDVVPCVWLLVQRHRIRLFTRNRLRLSTAVRRRLCSVFVLDMKECPSSHSLIPAASALVIAFCHHVSDHDRCVLHFVVVTNHPVFRKRPNLFLSYVTFAHAPSRHLKPFAVAVYHFLASSIFFFCQ